MKFLLYLIFTITVIAAPLNVQASCSDIEDLSDLANDISDEISNFHSNTDWQRADEDLAALVLLLNIVSEDADEPIFEDVVYDLTDAYRERNKADFEDALDDIIAIIDVTQITNC